MASIPARIQSQGIGTYNTNATGARPTAALPAIKSTGNAQPLEQIADRAGNQVQQNTARAISTVKGLPFAAGNLIQGVMWVNGAAQPVSHGLGAAYAGFFLLNFSAYVSGTPVATITADTPASLVSARIMLTPLGTFTSDVWVYR